VVFDFVNEKYEANSKGLLPYRTPIAEEQNIMMMSPLIRQEPVRINANIPHAIEYHEDGLNDIVQINKEWETFRENYEKVTCEKVSETEFKVLMDPLV